MALGQWQEGLAEKFQSTLVSKLKKLVNAAAVWQLASVIVAQSHLADINAKLKSIAEDIKGLSRFLDAERRSKITGSYNYLEQIYETLKDGELPIPMMTELESMEREMLGVFDHLCEEFSDKVQSPAPDNDWFGTEDLTKNACAKFDKLGNLASDLELCLRVRTLSWYVLAALPSAQGVQRARRRALEKSGEKLSGISDLIESEADREASKIEAFWNSESTLRERRGEVRSAGRKLCQKIEVEAAGSASELHKMIGDIKDSGKPMRLLLAVEDGNIIETKLAH